MPTPNKTQATTEPVELYLAGIKDPAQRTDAQLLDELLQKATGAKPVMWGSSIVGYGSYHYIYESGREGDTCAVGFSARKAALTIYGLFHYETNQQNIELAGKLGVYTHGKGCLYIKKLSDIDQDVLAQMAKSAFRARSN